MSGPKCDAVPRFSSLGLRVPALHVIYLYGSSGAKMPILTSARGWLGPAYTGGVCIRLQVHLGPGCPSHLHLWLLSASLHSCVPKPSSGC